MIMMVMVMVMVMVFSFDPLRPMSAQQTVKNERNSPAGHPRLTGQHARKNEGNWVRHWRRRDHA